MTILLRRDRVVSPRRHAPMRSHAVAGEGRPLFMSPFISLAVSLAMVASLGACDTTPVGIDGPVVPTTDVAMACADAESLPLDDTFSDDNYTLGASQALSGTCAAAAAERIYRFEAAAAGTLRFEWNSDVSTAV